jgi:hypothetical protein
MLLFIGGILMSKFIQFLAGFVAVVAILGCRTVTAVFSTPGPVPNPTAPLAPTASAQQIPALSGDWHMTITQSGGIMGMERTLEISSTGETTLTDARSHASSQAHLSAERLAALTKLVAGSKYQPAAMPSGCADCFIFDIQISSAGENFQVQLNQIDLVDSGLQPLVDFLAQDLK